MSYNRSLIEVQDKLNLQRISQKTHMLWSFFNDLICVATFVRTIFLQWQQRNNFRRMFKKLESNFLFFWMFKVLWVLFSQKLSWLFFPEYISMFFFWSHPWLHLRHLSNAIQFLSGIQFSAEKASILMSNATPRFEAHNKAHQKYLEQPDMSFFFSFFHFRSQS